MSVFDLPLPNRRKPSGIRSVGRAVSSGAGIGRVASQAGSAAGSAASAPGAVAAGIASSGSGATQRSAPPPSVQQLVHLVPPSFVPYLPTVISAANQYGVPASVLLAQLGQESGFGTASNTFTGSSAGAKGVSQFIPSTAQAYGVDTGSSPKAIRSQIEGQAHYMSDLVKQTGSLEGALTSYSGGYASSDYAQPILAAARNYSAADKVSQSALPSRASGGPYVDPFGGQIQIGRTDMGIDPYGPGVIRSIGRSRYLGTGGAGWPSEGGSGTGPVYKLLAGPQEGKNVYTYEGITPRTDLQRGDILRKGEPIARSTGSSFETGFAQGRAAGFQPLALAPGQPQVSPSHENTPAGQAFAKFVTSTQSGGSYPLLSGPVSLAAGTPSYGTTGGTFAAPAVQTALQSAKRQRRAAPVSLVQLSAPNSATATPPMPGGLAELFGGQVPQTAGITGGAPTSTTDLATLLAQLAGRTSPLSTYRRRRR